MKYRAIGENHLFVKVYAKGRHIGTPSCALHVLRDRHAFLIAKARPDKKQINRLGLTVSKKLGNAVKRSRARRVLREAFRQIDREAGVKTGNLIVLVAREKTMSAKTREVKKDLYYALSKLDLLASPRGEKANEPRSSAPEEQPGMTGPGKTENIETGPSGDFSGGKGGAL